MGMFAFLSCARENPCIDAFCWDVQTAGMAQEESDIKGETDLDGFLAEIERFPWYDQAVLAERNPTLSPTVSVTDLKTDRSVFISVGVAIVKAFFGRDDQELRRRLAPLSPYLRVKESGGWSAYMDKKQQIVKQIK